jgi:uncharacterized membrane protein YeaQ/YmgE (transglycosylase-associated protein family)
MEIISWILLGGLSGWLASLVTGNNSNMGFFLNVFVGIAGAFVGNFIFRYLNGSSVTGLNLASIAIAFVGAVVLLFIYNLLFRRENN